ncbi:MAG: DUF1848 domain-containing protein [Solobacterium sp.]|jgi:DNA repair photolyase|nr:DUF1848 domain-containing protein [Solobacterium sp.]
MILNTGSRTDIPAFYSTWFLNRIKAQSVLVRSPYAPNRLTRYRISPDVVDAICFCTKNPTPMLEHLNELSSFRQFWQVTVTPYGTDIEPNVPNKHELLDAVISLSELVGTERVFWRYDPIFISEKYSLEYHLRAFNEMASILKGHVSSSVISFIDLYDKTKRNFPQVREVNEQEIQQIGSAFSAIAKDNEMILRTCHEDHGLSRYGIDCSGCMTKDVLEQALQINLEVPSGASGARQGCRCLLSADIGAYNTCNHACRYCYANYDMDTVRRNLRKHDLDSELLIGTVLPQDEIVDAKQESWLSRRIHLEL